MGGVSCWAMPAHLSSPLGGEGLNAALMDAADIAWKLALVVRGAARPSLLDSYATERGAADHHVLEVSDEVHGFVMGLVAMCDGGGAPTLPPGGSGAETLAGMRRRSMLDVSYAGSALVGQAGAVAEGPSPGERFPARHRLSGTSHHLIVFGEAPRLDHLRARWGKLVSIVDASSAHFDATEAGVPNGGAILVRPDGFIGFRAAPADETTMAALDAHLATYLVPDVGARRDRALSLDAVQARCRGLKPTGRIAGERAARHTAGMPVHMDISPLHRLVVIVARGPIAAEEIAATTRQLVEANVPAYAKIIDVSQATSELTREQVQKVADLLRGAPGDTSRGPVAFVINPDRIGFANVFADVTQGERPIQLFRSLHEARAWLDRTRRDRRAPSRLSGRAGAVSDSTEFLRRTARNNVRKLPG